MRMYDIIMKKRNGLQLSKDEINYFINEYTKGNIPDYQVSALMMAIYFQKMNKRETSDLTSAMVNSGEVINLSSIDGIKVDKHSTGGVGDTVTMIVAPIVAALGVPVAKMSGRGLGHTGGTIDKLESFDGFSVDMSIENFINNVNTIGIAVGGQTANLAPADKKLYALRDVTATVDNLSLIASSIMSKKIASGADAIVLDVKSGSGAFMKDDESAFELGKAMVDIGSALGRNTIAVISDMDQPLGNAVGNILEVKEAIDTLKGSGPEDLTKLCITLGTYMLLLGGVANDTEAARNMIEQTIETGAGLRKLREFIKAQGGDTKYIDDLDAFEQAKYIYKVKAKDKGYVNHIKADDIGRAALILGAGRETKESQIDLTVGIYLNKKVGAEVEKGEIIAIIHANDMDKAREAERMILDAYKISNDKVKPNKLIKGIVTKNKIIRY
ncbi:pyrimidine-nucleoside phosphorylase [Abyssisolibacter fermentans]|uniref:pyrimidine-nucleoside phosphorylase n=1 Tax=Abyssisolibacter fermentans TaxID=1766203 RepID=UPI00082A74BA|nr:pyrimidine-nucleoside phosphorylase [Abyssisolibacter fermentans]